MSANSVALRPTIVYSVPGIGLGRAIRSKEIIQKLKDIYHYNVHVFTCGTALSFYRNIGMENLHELKDYVDFVHIDDKVSYCRTAWKTINTLFLSPKLFEDIEQEVRQLQPVAVITDFEPILARIAKKLKLKLISCDNQHKFSACSFPDSIGLQGRLYACAIGLFVNQFIPNPDLTIVSTFHYDLLEPADANTKLVNIFVRDSFKAPKPNPSNFILVYSKEVIEEKLLSCLRNIDAICIVYGTKREGSSRNMLFKKIDDEQFVKDLLRCNALICTAGNQLPGEARFLAKKMLLIPEPNQHEQYLNALCAEQLSIGRQCSIEDLSSDMISEFINEDSSISFSGDGEASTKAVNYIHEFLQRQREHD